MLVPNKTIPLEESILYKSTSLLSVLNTNIPVSDLYDKEKKKFRDLSEFLDSLDLLFVLGKISLNEETGEIEIA